MITRVQAVATVLALVPIALRSSAGSGLKAKPIWRLERERHEYLRGDSKHVERYAVVIGVESACCVGVVKTRNATCHRHHRRVHH